MANKKRWKAAIGDGNFEPSYARNHPMLISYDKIDSTHYYMTTLPE
jgi:hypothetical protein